MAVLAALVDSCTNTFITVEMSEFHCNRLRTLKKLIVFQVIARVGKTNGYFAELG